MIKLLNTRALVTKRYNFHGIFRLAIHTDSVAALREFEAEYGRFADSAPRAADLNVTICRFAAEGAGDERHFGRYRLAGDWIYGAERYKVARWSFALRGLAAPTTELYFHGGIFSLYFLQHFFIEQIMRFKISQKGVVLVHGGCVAAGDVAVLFPGLGHAGKTALALLQAVAGRQFLSDDYTFVAAHGRVYSYPRRLHLSDHIHDACPAVMRSLSLRHKLSIKAKLLIYYLTLTYGDLSESVQLAEVAPSARIADSAQLGAMLLLTSTRAAKPRPPQPIGEADLASRVATINCLEGKPFYNIYLGCQYNGDVPSLAEWWGHEQTLLRQALSGAACFEVTVPLMEPNRAAVLERNSRIIDQLLEEICDGQAVHTAPVELEVVPGSIS
jgi:hypothetical protein